MNSKNNSPATFAVSAGSDHDGAAVLQVVFEGQWCGAAAIPDAHQIRAACHEADARATCWQISSSKNFDWDSRAMVPLLALARDCEESQVELDTSGLPAGMQRLLKLATAVKPAAAEPAASPGFAAMVRSGASTAWRSILGFVTFIGELTIALVRFCTGRSHARGRDVVYFFEQCGPQAIAIVALISVLVGMILAYLGAVQLRQFGAEVYVANLVALGMVREMAPLMTAVIMAGRTGAAYAAQLGAMQSNEEIDAITTLGLSPMEYLVVPRFVALVIVMPMLCVFSNVVGIIGGALVASSMDISLSLFMTQAREFVALTDIVTGLFKSLVFAGLIAIAGCQAGIQSGRSSAAVGQATTRAVVHAIVYLVVADTALNVMYDKLGI